MQHRQGPDVSVKEAEAWRRELTFAAGWGWSQGFDRGLTPKLVPLATVLVTQFVTEEVLIPGRFRGAQKTQD